MHLSAPVATALTRSQTRDLSPETLMHSAAIIDYNVGDGGSAYEVMVVEALTGFFQLSRHTLNFRRWGSLKYFAAPIEFARARHFLTNCPDSSVVVKTCTAAWLNPPRQPPSIVILHHIGSSDNWLYPHVEQHILRQLWKADAVVVVSKYWKHFLMEHGLTNVHTIYNAFRVNEFEFTREEIETFKKRYNLLGKPIIYTGTHRSEKGVDETFDA